MLLKPYPMSMPLQPLRLVERSYRCKSHRVDDLGVEPRNLCRSQGLSLVRLPFRQSSEEGNGVEPFGLHRG